MAALAIIGGLLCALVGYRETRLACVAKPQPRRITCAELASRGPGDNAHVEIEKLMVCFWVFVYEKKQKSVSNSASSRDSEYATIWVPAVPIGGPFHKKLTALIEQNDNRLPQNLPSPKTIRVLIKSTDCPTDEAVFDLGQQKVVRGVVVNEIESLGSQERGQLGKSYPGANLEQIYIVEHGRRPAGVGKRWGLSIAGLLLIVAGVGGGLMLLRART